MSELTMPERMAKVEERAKSNTHRIDQLESLATEIHQQNIAITELCGELKRTNDNAEKTAAIVADHDDRLDAIESKPLVLWDKIKIAAESAAVTVAVTAIVGALMALLR